jgi:dihydroorotate dehydrogenase electron transfer subunit
MSSAGERNIVPSPGQSRVVFNRSVGSGWFLLRLEEPQIAAAARPGQFVQVLTSGQWSRDPLLRRPFSIYSTDRRSGTYDILYVAVGRGTGWMAALGQSRQASIRAAGAAAVETVESIDVEGPFGNSFSLPAPGARVYLVGGGVGVAPLYFFAREILAAPLPPQVTLCMGARTRGLLQGIEEFRRLPVRAETATDDGSEGFHGRVTELLLDLLAREPDPKQAQVYGCGPQGMNESLRALALRESFWCEICLESLMACGFGICFGCVAPIRKALSGDYYNRRICWEGPVFDARLLHPGIDGLASGQLQEPS